MRKGGFGSGEGRTGGDEVSEAPGGRSAARKCPGGQGDLSATTAQADIQFTGANGATWAQALADSPMGINSVDVEMCSVTWTELLQSSPYLVRALGYLPVDINQGVGSPCFLYPDMSGAVQNGVVPIPLPPPPVPPLTPFPLTRISITTWGVASPPLDSRTVEYVQIDYTCGAGQPYNPFNSKVSGMIRVAWSNP
jgi:hypothetical protein